MGIALNGEAISECAGMQLPTLILDKMDAYHTYYMLLYNNFNNNLNIAIDGEIYPELTGRAFPSKIVELWGEFYLSPKIKDHFIKRFNRLLPQCLPPSNKEHAKKALVENNLELVRFDNPREVVADKLWEMISIFKARSTESSTHHVVEKDRKKIIRRINNDAEDEPKMLRL